MALLESLAPQLEIKTSLANKDKPGREIALACLMPWLNGEMRELVQRQVIAAMRQQNDKWQRAALLRTLALQLRGNLLSLVSEAGLPLDSEWSNHPELLITLAPYLFGEQLYLPVIPVQAFQ